MSAPSADRESGDFASPTPADSSRLSLDWSGTYSGIEPCPDCPDTAVTVTLSDDGRFERTLRPLSDSPVPDIHRGRFEWNDRGSAVTLIPDDGDPAYYQVGEHRLFLLDGQGERVVTESGANVVLDQHLGDPRIEGRRWRLVELGGAPVDAEGLRERPYFELDPEDDRVHGNASCNMFNGAYAIRSGQRITFGPNLAMTMMACPDMAVEDRFTDVLTSADSFSVGANGALTLNRARMAPLARFEAVDSDG
ncbi:META domain-containing protein [Wenzhouxiangella sp. XN79A]|uniref:META domain-containing protein n=1 Tax=Wenzhouxiangella sp. XN79A TaxID=2724193 RepID=UPI00144A9AE8|nr:META domain-containing protein [Wenzhouxiangella sp. XN79A]